MSFETLLPCPFCGGEPEEDAGGCIEYHGHEHQDYSITCKQCGAEVYCSVGAFERADVPCSCHHDTRKVCVDKWNKRAAMLQAGTLTNEDTKQAGNSPVIPDGYVMVPMRLTAENGAKGALSGEFSETKFVNCPECFGDDECETCDGSGRIEVTVPVTWTTIKEIWAKGVEHFAADPQSPGSEPATVPGKWIPVSERMPEVGDIVLTAMGGEVNVGEMECSAANCRFFTSVISGRELPATHWMPLPAAPQEVKGE